MLAWWHEMGIDRADLAVKLPSGAMMWHRGLAAPSLPLAWARAQNVRRAEIYIRPARGFAWPIVFLDDVAAPLARAVAHKYDALVVETSHGGGCHIWLACDRPLTEAERRRAQRWLAQRVDADLGSISGEHLGRLAGFKNWKRGGTWINVLAASRYERPWDPTVVPSACCAQNAALAPIARHLGRTRVDVSPSGREWGWVCDLLEAGWPLDLVYARLLEKARARRGPDAARYAQRTLQHALERAGRTAARPRRPQTRRTPKEVGLQKA